MSLDHSKLVNLRPTSDGWTSQCPACAAGGADSTGNHLKIFRTGKYGCCVDTSDSHSKVVWALAGSGGGSTNDLPSNVVEPQLELPRTWPTALLDRLVKDYSYWASRGISEKTIEPFRGGVATDGQMKGRFVFPIFNEEEEIVGFNGRWIHGKTDKPWKILGRSSTFVWGGLDDISDRVILTESIGDSLMLREHGVPESICLFGVNMGQAVLGRLITLNPSLIIVSTNRDETHGVGQRAAIKVKKTLDTFWNSDRVEIRHPPEGVKDWGEATAEQIKQTFNT